MKHFLASALLAIVLVLSFGASAHAAAVNGWAWSSNIGWMQFNTGSSQPVTIDPATGSWAGYAWSSNIGWIDFSGATVNVSTGAVSGWAQALSANGNGWDGKIELAGTNHSSPDMTGKGGVTMIPSTGKFIGFAWGGPVVGWLQFNGLGGGSTGGPTSDPNDPVCAGCSGGGPAPVISASCSATSPNANLAPNTAVSYKVTPSTGTGPYAYSWEGQASTSASTYSKSYAVSSVNGPIVRVGDTASPVKGYSAPIICPGATVLQPLGASNIHIGRGSSPTGIVANSLNVNQGVTTPFILVWNITLTNDYSCTASVGNDPGVANWNTNWKTLVLNGSNGTDNGDGTITWSSNTAGSLNAPSTGLAVGAYQFRLTCTGGALGTQSTSATLRVTSTSENEI